MLKAMSMMLVSVIGIGIVAYSISITPPDTSVDCEEQICTSGTIAQVVDGDTVKFLSDLKKISFEEFSKITSENFFHLFGNLNWKIHLLYWDQVVPWAHPGLQIIRVN